MFCANTWLFAVNWCCKHGFNIDKVYSLQYSESFTGSLFMTSNIGPYMSLRNSPLEVFSNSQQNYNCCLLTIGINTVAVFKNSEQSFQIFDSHSRDLYGMPDSYGRRILVRIEGLENVASYLQILRCCFSWFIKQVRQRITPFTVVIFV